MAQDTGGMDAPTPRSTSQRHAHVLAALDKEYRLWLATGNADGPHMIALAYVWTAST